jgi:hypothetical protein
MYIQNKKNLFNLLFLIVVSVVLLTIIKSELKTEFLVESHSILLTDKYICPLSKINQPVLHSDEIIWEKAPSLVVNDSGYAHVYNEKIYFVGGSAVQEFDLSRGTWRIVNDEGLGYQPYRGGSALMGDRIHFVHGWTAEKTTYYDIGDNSFGTFTPANYNRLDVAVTALDGNLYVSGGWASGNTAPTARFAVYDLLNDTWSSLEPMGTARKKHEMVAVGGYIYAIGGVLGECPMERYDPTIDTWEYLGNGPAFQGSRAAVIDDNRIIVGSSIHTQIYLINENKWYQGPKSNLTSTDLVTVAAVGASTLAILDDHVYSIGGRDAPGNYYNYVWKTKIIIPPLIDQPRNIVYNEGTTGHFIVWNAVDDNPSTYNITKNGELVLNGTWNGESINISVDGLSGGKHEFRCTVIDQDGHYVDDLVLVTVIDDTPPVIDHPEDIEIEEGSKGQIITWHPSDNNPGNYVITRNVMVVKSGSWNGSPITLNLDDLSSGNYSFVCEVFDTSKNSISDIVMVTVIKTRKTARTPWNLGFVIIAICFTVLSKRIIKMKRTYITKLKFI